MNFKRLFVFVIFAVLVLTDQTEAGKLKKLGKKIVSLFVTSKYVFQCIT